MKISLSEKLTEANPDKYKTQEVKAFDPNATQKVGMPAGAIAKVLRKKGPEAAMSAAGISHRPKSGTTEREPLEHPPRPQSEPKRKPVNVGKEVSALNKQYGLKANPNKNTAGVRMAAAGIPQPKAGYVHPPEPATPPSLKNQNVAARDRGTPVKKEIGFGTKLKAAFNNLRRSDTTKPVKGAGIQRNTPSAVDVKNLDAPALWRQNQKQAYDAAYKAPEPEAPPTPETPKPAAPEAPSAGSAPMADTPAPKAEPKPQAAPEPQKRTIGFGAKFTSPADAKKGGTELNKPATPAAPEAPAAPAAPVTPEPASAPAEPAPKEKTASKPKTKSSFFHTPVTNAAVKHGTSLAKHAYGFIKQSTRIKKY